MSSSKERLVVAPLAGYVAEIGSALWNLEDARARTLTLLKENAADAAVDTESGGNTIGTILYHVALIEADWLFSEILEEPLSESLKELFPVDDRDQHGILSVVRDRPLEDHLERLRRVRDVLLDRLRGMTLEDFHRPRNLPAYDVSPAWVLHHLAQHDAEHRAEIGSILATLRQA